MIMNVHLWNGIGCILGAILTGAIAYLLFNSASKAISKNFQDDWTCYPHLIVPGGAMVITSLGFLCAAWTEIGLGVFK